MLRLPCAVLEDEVIRLRPLQAEDFNALHAAANDPLLWEQHPEPMRWQVDVFRTYFEGAMSADCAFVFELRATGEVVGSSRYRPLANPTAVEIGWTFVARSHWGTGLNGRVKALMIAHAFTAYEHVVFYGGGDNFRSRRAIEKLGATELRSTDAAGLWDADPEKFTYVLSR